MDRRPRVQLVLSGRVNDWTKVTCRQRETLQIVGYALKNNRFDGLYLGRQNGDQLLKGGSWLFNRHCQRVRERLTPLVQRTQDHSQKIKKPKAVWVKPSLLVEVEYRAKSAHGKLRHPSIKGIREDL